MDKEINENENNSPVEKALIWKLLAGLICIFLGIGLLNFKQEVLFLWIGLGLTFFGLVAFTAIISFNIPEINHQQENDYYQQDSR